MNLQEVVTLINSHPERAKNALENVFRDKVFVTVSYNRIDGYFKTRKGAEGYINKQQRVSWYDDYSHKMVTAGAGLEVVEVSADQIKDIKTDKTMWFNWLLDCLSVPHFSDNVVYAAKRYGVSVELLSLIEESAKEVKEHQSLTSWKEEVEKTNMENKNNENKEELDTMTNTMDVLKEYNAKIRNLTYNKQDVVNHFDFLVNNKDKFYIDFMEFLNTSEKYKKKRKATKEEITKEQYKVELGKLGYADKDIYTIESGFIGFDKPQTEDELLQKKINNMQKIIDKITDESIQLHIASKQEKRAELTKAIKDPETLEEFETKLRITTLSEVEQVKYEELKALKQVEENEAKKIKTIEAIENAEFEIKESKHTKTGEQIFIVNMKERVDRDKFNEINIKMKSLGAYYSNFPSNRGFIFKTDPKEMLNTLQNGEDIEVKKERDAQAQAEKLEQLADNMQETIDYKKGDRKTNTAKREREAASAYADGEAMEFTQSILKTIAQAIAEGSTTFLKGINAKTHIETMEKLLGRMKRENDRVNGLSWEDSRKRTLTESDILTLEYPKALAHRDHLNSVLRITTNKKGYLNTSRKISKLTPLTKDDYLIDVTRYKDEIYSLAYAAMQIEKYSSESIKDCFNDINRLQAMGIFTIEHLRSAMREYLQLRPTRSNEETKEQKIKKMESKARFQSNIDGYFPTPKTIVQRMIDLADIRDGERVLEPSAGNGNILDAITAEVKNRGIIADVEGIECNLSLREILELKQYKLVSNDFMEYAKYNNYDKIVMNPPFEQNKDVLHIQHAYKHLKEGGRIVAIMSPHWTFANDTKSVSFREWLDGRGYYEKLPEGSFKESGTGVNTVLVVIDKIEETKAEAI